MEATLVMPLTCLIIISLLSLMMLFCNQLIEKAKKNEAEMERICSTKEVDFIRGYDRIEYEIVQ